MKLNGRVSSGTGAYARTVTFRPNSVRPPWERTGFGRKLDGSGENVRTAIYRDRASQRTTSSTVLHVNVNCDNLVLKIIIKYKNSQFVHKIIARLLT